MLAGVLFNCLPADEPDAVLLTEPHCVVARDEETVLLFEMLKPLDALLLVSLEAVEDAARGLAERKAARAAANSLHLALKQDAGGRSTCRGGDC